MAGERATHLGSPGGSASLKAQRIREQRQARQASRSGLGRIAAALFEPETDKRLRQEERRWTAGAGGEQSLASYLARHCPDIPMLHDRRAAGTRGNIDHIAVAPSGIYVIDCKRYKGKIEVTQPLFGKPKLKINGREQTKLVEGLDQQVQRVRATIADSTPEIPIRGCLCFVAPGGFLADSGLPLLRTLKLNGYPLYYPRRLAKHLNERGTLTPEHCLTLQGELAERLPAAPAG